MNGKRLVSGAHLACLVLVLGASPFAVHSGRLFAQDVELTFEKSDDSADIIEDVIFRAVDDSGQPVDDAQFEVKCVLPQGNTMLRRPSEHLGADWRTSRQALFTHVDFIDNQPRVTPIPLVAVVATNRNNTLGGIWVYNSQEKLPPPRGVIEVMLKPTQSFSGQVVDLATDQPLMGVTVAFSGKFEGVESLHYNYKSPGTSDADGRFELMGLIDGMPGYVHLRRDGYRQLSQEVYSPGAATPQLFRLVPTSLPADMNNEVSLPSIEGMNPLEAVQHLIKHYDIAEQEYQQQQRTADQAEPVQHWIRMRFSPLRPWIEVLRRLAEANPDSDAEVLALVWCCRMSWLHSHELGRDAQDVLGAVSERLLAHYIDRPELAECVEALAASQKNPAKTLRKLYQQNPSRVVQAFSLMGQIEIRRRQLEFDDLLRDDRMLGGSGKLQGRMSSGETDEQGELIFREVDREVLTDEQRREIIAEQLSMLNEMQGRGGDVPHWRDGDMQRRAAKLKHELENLQVGAVAPPLIWTDNQGRRLDLASVRGKVVLIYFWGSWCRPCRKHLPELNRIHKELGETVAIIGVMSEQDLAAGEQAIDANDIQWPNLIEESPGPLADQWNVDSWPSIFILDQEGRIRFRKFSKAPNVEEIRRRVERLILTPDAG